MLRIINSYIICYDIVCTSQMSMDECDKASLYQDSCRPSIYMRPGILPHSSDYSGKKYHCFECKTCHLTILVTQELLRICTRQWRTWLVLFSLDLPIGNSYIHIYSLEPLLIVFVPSSRIPNFKVWTREIENLKEWHAIVLFFEIFSIVQDFGYILLNALLSLRFCYFYLRVKLM